MTLICTFLLTHMPPYILPSINGPPYHFTLTSILPILFTLILFIFPQLTPMKQTQTSTQHS
ncbi:DUF2929 family protein [Bacillus altitudinis]|uniref:DUF2929 family protein n=1 Tax=Bacillus altitudinis TaxID=293387 RepID=UPI00235258F0|nr:DUF2929 family protein [Bacillus altitudinis]